LRYVQIAVLLLAMVPGALHADRSAAKASFVGPKAYYLALGDSVTYGATPIGPALSFVDDLGLAFSLLGTRQVVNFGCPGETTTTFIHGGCRWSKIVRYPHAGAQLSAALAVLHAHPGVVSPVTVEVGYDDAPSVALIQPGCTLTYASKIRRTLATFDANLQTILSALQTALHGTGDLLVLNLYVATQNSCPASNKLQQQFNQHLAADVVTEGATLVPIYDIFNTPSGQSPTLCRLTWMCTSYKNIHPNPTGQMAIAQRILSITGYGLAHASTP
jgi:lysophospholipase L1-like esterase